MARYIDAEKIDFSMLKNDFDRARAKVMVMATPTADVVEVKRGKWLNIIFTQRYECSLCGNEIYFGKDKFCSECGAKMDGGRDT